MKVLRESRAVELWRGIRAAAEVERSAERSIKMSREISGYIHSWDPLFYDSHRLIRAGSSTSAPLINRPIECRRDRFPAASVSATCSR